MTDKAELQHLGNTAGTSAIESDAFLGLVGRVRKDALNLTSDILFKKGKTYYSGEGVKQDYLEAATWFRKAADMGHAEALNRLGCMYFAGEGYEKDFELAASCFEKSAAMDFTWAQNNLAKCYREGWGIKRDHKKCLSLYIQSAQSDNTNAAAKAAFELGLIYMHLPWGQAPIEGTARDETEALKWFMVAADAGDLDGLMVAANMHKFDGDEGSDDDQESHWAKSAELYLRAAMQGHRDAQFELASMLEVGVGVAKDERRAVEWYTEAANQDHVEAQFKLGMHYATGSGVKQSYDEARIWFRKAADKGHEQARTIFHYRLHGMI